MKRSDLNRLNHAYHRTDVAADAESIERARDERPQMLVARIESFTLIGTYRWLYTWSLAEIQPSSVGVVIMARFWGKRITYPVIGCTSNPAGMFAGSMPGPT
jgi:hypothetical protein